MQPYTTQIDFLQTLYQFIQTYTTLNSPKPGQYRHTQHYTDLYQFIVALYNAIQPHTSL